MKPDINHERIAELQNLDEDGSNLVLKNIIGLFLNNIPMQLNNLKCTFENQDYAHMKAIAHSISGSSLDLGADSLASIARRIEGHGTGPEDLSSLGQEIAGIQSYFEQIKLQYLELKRSIPGK